MEHLNVFNSLKNSKTIVGKLISLPNPKTSVEVNDIVDVNGKLVFIQDNDVLLKLTGSETKVQCLTLQVVNKSSKLIVSHELLSNTFKKAVADLKVKLNSLVVIVVKNDGFVDDIEPENPELFINNDGYAVIKHYISKSFRKDSKIPDVRFDEKEWQAVKRFQTGERWATNHFMENDVISAGYGVMTDDGVFEFPLPKVYIKQIYNTHLWSEVSRRSKTVNV